MGILKQRKYTVQVYKQAFQGRHCEKYVADFSLNRKVRDKN
jgi:hypothetical protein